MGAAPTSAPRLLATYLRKAGIGVTELARRAGVSHSVVSRAIRRERRPGMSVAFRIEIATAGAVPAAAWLSWRERAA